MSEQKVMNRSLVVVGAVLIQLCLGAIYAWSVFTPSLTDPEGPFAFSGVQTQAIFSVGLMDLICPPSTVFAAYNHFAGPKDVRIYQYNDHEGGENYQTVEKVKFLAKMWPEASAD